MDSENVTLDSFNATNETNIEVYSRFNNQLRMFYLIFGSIGLTGNIMVLFVLVGFTPLKDKVYYIH